MPLLFVLVDHRNPPLTLSVVPGLVIVALVASACVTKLGVVRKSFEPCIKFETVLTALTVPS